MDNSPLVSIVIVALNEEKSLPMLFDNLNQQDYDHQNIEILLVDSMSKDKTRHMMENFSKLNDFKRVVCLENEGIIQASGWNVGLAHAAGDIIIRLDAHIALPTDFIAKNVNCILRGENICGGKVTSYCSANTKWVQTVNIAENSAFGGSIAPFRRKESPGYVKTLAFAAYRKEVFDMVGFFNENLLRTEDNEIHYRMRKAGYKFYYDPEIVSKRETRPSLKKLLRQKYGNGYWVGLTLSICPKCFSLYHIIPFLFVCGMLISFSLVGSRFGFLSMLFWVLYGLCTVLMAIVAALQSRTFNFSILLLPILFLLLHTSYGIGTLIGLLKSSIWKRKIKSSESAYDKRKSRTIA